VILNGFLSGISVATELAKPCPLQNITSCWFLQNCCCCCFWVLFILPISSGDHCRLGRLRAVKVLQSTVKDWCEISKEWNVCPVTKPTVLEHWMNVVVQNCLERKQKIKSKI